MAGERSQLAPDAAQREAGAVIATYGLTKRFERQVAVNDVDLQVAPGKIYGLIGPNGAGKTTLLRLLAAVEAPTRGEIYLHGERLSRGADSAHLRRRLGYLPDDFPVYDDLSVWDYLDYFARLYRLRQSQRRRRLQEVLELVQLTPKRKSAVATLSRGMKQRLSLARTLVPEPTVLLLDEPTSQLDPASRQTVWDAIRTLQEAGMTTIIASHGLGDLEALCTSVGILELGHLVESAPLPVLHRRWGSPGVVISVSDGWDNLQQALAGTAAVKRWEPLTQQGNSGRIWLQFEGDARDRAELLRSLVQAGVAVTEFRPHGPTLEQIFQHLDHQQAD